MGLIGLPWLPFLGSKGLYDKEPELENDVFELIVIVMLVSRCIVIVLFIFVAIARPIVIGVLSSLSLLYLISTVIITFIAIVIVLVIAMVNAIIVSVFVVVARC